MIDIVRTDVSLTDWDSLVFTVHWPVTTCILWKDGKPGNTCILPENHVWTVHGIWYVTKQNLIIFYINWILSQGQIRKEDKDLSFATGRGSLTRNKSILSDRSCSKFGQTFTEMTPTIRCGNTSGKNTEPALHSILNLRQKNFISTKEFNGLVDTLQLLNVIVLTKDLIDRSRISTWQRFCTSTWLSPQCRQSTMSLRF